MNTIGLVASALAVAGASFGAGRLTASATSSATATAAPSACETNDALAEMLKKGAADREASHQRDLAAAEASQNIKVTKIDPSPVH